MLASKSTVLLMNVCVRVHVYACMRMCVSTVLYAYNIMYVCVQAYIHTYIPDTYINIYIYVHTYTTVLWKCINQMTFDENLAKLIFAIFISSFT